MSFCRFSSNDFSCDAHVHESVYGYEIHLAGARVVFDAPLPPPVPLSPECIDAFVAREVQVSKMVDKASRVPLGLPHDGESFTYPTAAACADKLVELQALGYRIPDDVIAALRTENDDPAQQGAA